MPTKKITSKDCITCGICCVAPGGQDSYCDITEKDAERLGKRFVRLHVLQPRTFDQFAAALDGVKLSFGVIKTAWREQKTGPFKGHEFNTCAALRGSVMHRVSCTVYEKRPATCRRSVLPGDSNCLFLRQEFKQALDRI